MVSGSRGGCIWSLNGVSFQDDGQACSVFTFDIAANKSRLPLAKNAVRKSRTLRHPGVIKVLDTIEVWMRRGIRGCDNGMFEADDMADGIESVYRY